MSKNVLFLFLTSSLIISFLFSCEKEDNDNLKPTLEIKKPLPNQTLYMDSTYRFEAVFQDDKGLSSYFIQISDPDININHLLIPNPDSTKTDSILYLNQIIQRANIFGIKDTAVTVAHSFIVDTIGYFEGRGPFDIVRGKYQFKVVVMDKGGNRDSSFFYVDIASPLTY